MSRKIEYVTSSYLVSGNEGGVVTINGEQCRARYSSTIVYDDGSEKTIDAVAECHAYLRDGFITKSGGNYQFYDVDGKLLAVKDMSAFGECTEIAPLNDLYIFDFNERGPFEVGKNRFLFDRSGNKCACSNRLVGIPVHQLYEAYGPEDDAVVDPEPLRLSDEIASLERSLSKM